MQLIFQRSFRKRGRDFRKQAAYVATAYVDRISGLFPQRAISAKSHKFPQRGPRFQQESFPDFRQRGLYFCQTGLDFRKGAVDAADVAAAYPAGFVFGQKSALWSFYIGHLEAS